MGLVAAVLVLGVIFVNGWTDAPNAIATCISTRAMPPGRAMGMAAVFNFLGACVMTRLSPAVVTTVGTLADFGGNTARSLIALSAAMGAVVLWAVVAWRFGIPTSESHALVAGISGAAVALGGQLNPQAWQKVVVGLVLSVFLGFGLGFLLTRCLARLAAGHDRLRCARWFEGGEVLGGAAMAFLHGAQDGQKFMAVLLLVAAFGRGESVSAFVVPLPLVLLCSAVMALGTSVGGGRIIRSVGVDMVRLRPHQGLGADVAAGVCLLFSTLTGLPVSTTQTKATAVMGAGASMGLRRVNWRIAKELVLTWVYTLPGCGALGYLFARILLLFAEV